VYGAAKQTGGDMTLETIIKHFGGISQTARALAVTRQTVYNWQRAGDIPEPRRYQAQAIIAVEREKDKRSTP
jgi:DNA invertase Pin-like site-specific DNA recombinase